MSNTVQHARDYTPLLMRGEKRVGLFLLTLFFLFSANTFAQKVSVTGKITDATTQETLPGAAAVLLNPKDSTQVSGAAANSSGAFTIPAVKVGSYILKISYMGYQTYFQNLTLTKKESTHSVGTVALSENAKMMKEADIVGRVAQVEMKADTFVYNADAYRLPEGSNLEELVKKLPGAQVSDDGTITINGKEVKKIMVDGKEFFDNDTKMAMKNLPTKMVNKIKAYDKKSDYSRVTGIDDGEEETVLDLTVKKGMKEGWLINLDGAYGTEKRYSGKGMISRFLDHSQFTIIGSGNNVNDMGFPGGGGWGRGGGGGSGIVESQMAGINFAWENGKPDYSAGLLKMGGNVRFNRTSTESITRTNSETFLGDNSSTWGNSLSNSTPIAWNINANFRIEWMPDSLTNILFRPNYSHNDNTGNSSSSSVTFDHDPYSYMTDPLSEYSSHEMRDSITVNDNIRSSVSDSYTNSTDAELQVNRQLGKAGRNLTLNVSGAYSKTESKSQSISSINYYKESSSKKSSYTNQYNLNPSESYNVRAKLSYTEPITKYLNLQTSYQFQHRYSQSDRTMYSLDSLLTKFPEYYTAEQLYMGYLPGLDTLDMLINRENSKYATYYEYNHDASIMARYNRKFENEQELRINAGVSFQPQRTDLYYQKSKLDTIVSRNIFNWAPRVDVRWKISQTSQLRARYNGRMTQPSMTNLLEVTDSSDPLNISTGNSGLESSWNNNANIFYNNYIEDKQMSWAVFASWSQTLRSISTATIYDKNTGTKFTRPMNIDGNWNTNLHLMFNTAIDKNKLFNFSSGTNFSYANNVGYISSNTDENFNVGDYTNPDGTIDMSRLFNSVSLNTATTKTTNIGENLRFTYRNDIFSTGSIEVGVTGSFNYQHARNDMQTNANLDTWSFNYGGNLILTMPWGTSLSTDFGPQYRRGYQDESMNTTELIWNAQLSQSFLKDNALTVSVQWYDILRERSNISRTISATMRSDTETNAINSYLMVHLIYKLNLLGNKEARNAMGPGGFGGPDGGRGGDRGGNNNKQGSGNRGGGFGGPGGGGPGRF